MQASFMIPSRSASGGGKRLEKAHSTVSVIYFALFRFRNLKPPGEPVAQYYRRCPHLHFSIPPTWVPRSTMPLPHISSVVGGLIEGIGIANM